MLDALDHRGPDDRAVHVQAPIGFAHTRLSVIELRQTVHEVLDEAHLKKLGFKTYFVEALKREHFTGVANHAFKLWAVMNFVEWHRLFVQGRWSQASNLGDAA